MKSRDITDRLNEKQFKELKELASENDFKEVVSLDEFKKATIKWRDSNTTQKLHYSTRKGSSKNPY